jgi:hypothetical protein
MARLPLAGESGIDSDRNQPGGEARLTPELANTQEGEQHSFLN